MLLLGNIYIIFFLLLMFMFLLFSGLSLKLLVGNLSIFVEWNFLWMNSFDFSWVFFFDWMGGLFLSLIMLISGSIFYYCGYYMNGDENYKRFMFILFLFVMSMVLLVVSPNIISILLGWDGLGLSSYLLVIYYQNEKSYDSGMLTILMNRMGDVCMIIILGFFFGAGSWNMMSFDFLSVNYSIYLMYLACMIKSAQMPFSAWLPAAMAAPTPVSSLVHSSTLVTAGVYLMVRFNNLVFNYFFFYVGVLTTFLASISANLEGDMKKVIALSTLSQLGYMMMSIGMGMFVVGYFHMIIHAIFKSMLFMSGGFMIHSCLNNQDFRYVSFYEVSSPFLLFCVIVSNLSLCGIPFLSGFFSKDLLMEIFFFRFENFSFLFLVVLCIGLTVSYSLRFLYNSMKSYSEFFSMSVGSNFNYLNFLSCLLLVGLCMIGGYLYSYLFMYMHMSGNILSGLVKYMILLMSVLYALVGYMYMSMKFIYVSKVYFYFVILDNWFFTVLSTIFFEKLIFVNVCSVYKVLDKGWFEHYGFMGVGLFLFNIFGSLQNSMRSGMIFYYLYFFFMILLIVLF